MVDVGTEVADNVLGRDHSGAYTRQELGVERCAAYSRRLFPSQIGGLIMVAGLYSSIQSIIDGEHRSSSGFGRGTELPIAAGYRNGGFPAPFSCANQAI